MAFQRAERRRAYLKLAVDGPSGSGKTYSSLRMARGLVGPHGKIAMIDTENGSGSLYADLTEYDVMEIHPPFTVQKYLAAIREAEEGNYDVLVIDSLTHEWDGEGGLLDQKLALDKRPNSNSFTNWATISKQHKEFTAQVLQSRLHIIATMRSKTEYALQEDSRGKSVPVKMGLAPIQRDGMDYEFTTVFDIVADHTAAVSKDRTGLFAGLCSTLTEAHGKLLRDWLEGGAEPLPEPERRQEAPAPAAAPQATPPPESRGDAAANGHAPAPALKSNGQCIMCNAPLGAKHGNKCSHAGQINGEAAAPQPPAASTLPAWQRHAHALWAELAEFWNRDAKSREDRLHYTKEALGRPVASWNDLAPAEGAQVVAVFTKWRDAEKAEPEPPADEDPFAGDTPDDGTLFNLPPEIASEAEKVGHAR